MGLHAYISKIASITMFGRCFISILFMCMIVNHTLILV